MFSLNVPTKGIAPNAALNMPIYGSSRLIHAMVTETVGSMIDRYGGHRVMPFGQEVGLFADAGLDLRASKGSLRLLAGAVRLDERQTPAGAERRCGWLANPTPANYWLNDRDGEWTLSAQGGYRAPGMDEMPDMTTNGWVETNGS